LQETAPGTADVQRFTGSGCADLFDGTFPFNFTQVGMHQNSLRRWHMLAYQQVHGLTIFSAAMVDDEGGTALDQVSDFLRRKDRQRSCEHIDLSAHANISN
jgi:hypothetical protein